MLQLQRDHLAVSGHFESTDGTCRPHSSRPKAGFRKGRSCTDQIATLRIILEQSLEWNTSLYVNFIDYEKAFDSLDRQTLWNQYEGMTCRVVHGQQLTYAFRVLTGVRQGCLQSPFLFLLAIDWLMKMSTEEKRNGIQWTLWEQLDDLDYADDLALLSDTQQQMQGKSDTLSQSSTCIGLNIQARFSGSTPVTPPLC